MRSQFTPVRFRCCPSRRLTPPPVPLANRLPSISIFPPPSPPTDPRLPPTVVVDGPALPAAGRGASTVKAAPPKTPPVAGEKRSSSRYVALLLVLIGAALVASAGLAAVVEPTADTVEDPDYGVGGALTARAGKTVGCRSTERRTSPLQRRRRKAHPLQHLPPNHRPRPHPKVAPQPSRSASPSRRQRIPAPRARRPFQNRPLRWCLRPRLRPK